MIPLTFTIIIMGFGRSEVVIKFIYIKIPEKNIHSMYIYIYTIYTMNVSLVVSIEMTQDSRQKDGNRT